MAVVTRSVAWWAYQEARDLIASYATGAVDGGAGLNDDVGRLVGAPGTFSTTAPSPPATALVPPLVKT